MADGEGAKWDITDIATGIILVNLPAATTADLDVGRYEGQGRFILTAETDVDKTQRFIIKINEGIIPD